MSGRMPILREDDVAEMPGEVIDERHHLIATRHGQGAVGAEIVLYVDDDESVAVADGVSRGQVCLQVFVSLSSAVRRQIQLPCVRLSSCAASLTRSSPISTE